MPKSHENRYFKIAALLTAFTAVVTPSLPASSQSAQESWNAPAYDPNKPLPPLIGQYRYPKEDGYGYYADDNGVRTPNSCENGAFIRQIGKETCLQYRCVNPRNNQVLRSGSACPSHLPII